MNFSYLPRPRTKFLISFKIFNEISDFLGNLKFLVFDITIIQHFELLCKVYAKVKYSVGGTKKSQTLRLNTCPRNVM